MSKLTILKNFVGKLEASEGVAETLAAADAKSYSRNQRITLDPEFFNQNLDRNTFAELADLIGKRPGSGASEFIARGASSATATPDWWKYMQPCGVGVSDLKSINIGVVTNGPFVHGETITGGTSNGKGRVIKKTANGASDIWYVMISPLSSVPEIITGGTSGASATTSSSPSTVGKVAEPITDAIPTMTGGFYQHGIRRLLKGCRGTGRFHIKTGNPMLFSPEYMGVEAGIIDDSFLTGVVPETTTAPIFQSATMTVDGVAAKIGELDFNFGCRLAGRDDPASDRGILSFLITGRETRGSFNPEMLSVASHDFHGKMHSNALMELIAIWGTTPQKFQLYMPAVQYIGMQDEEADGRWLNRVQLKPTGSLVPGNDDWALISGV